MFVHTSTNIFSSNTTITTNFILKLPSEHVLSCVNVNLIFDVYRK